MGLSVQEVYTPVPLAANATVVIAPGPIVFGGFFCTTGGTFTLQDNNGNTIVPAVTLAVGQTAPPVGCMCPGGAKVILSGGCVGTAFYTSAFG